MSRFDAFDPLVDTSGYDFATQAYYELYQAHYNRSVLLDPGLLMNMAKWENMRNRAPILILNYQYNILDTMAIDNNLLSLQSGYLYDVAGRPRSPYLSQHFQLATPLTDTLYTNSVQFCVLPIFISRNTGLDVQRVVADFGDGSGQHTLNGPLDSITINYPSNGEKIMTLQVTLSDGSSFSTKNKIVLQANNNMRIMGTDASDPCFSEYITSDMAYQGLDDAAPYRGSFKVNYYYRTNDGTTCFTGKKNIKKPIILIDGFDPTDKRDAAKLYKQFLFYIDDVNFPPYPPVSKDLVRDLRDAGYDVILVDIPSYVITNSGQYIQRPTNSNNWPNGWTYFLGKVIRGGGDYVQRNAYTLIKLINQLNQDLASQGSTEKLVIVGPSMGGQISRYALRWMELNGQNHNCRLWVSFDSNHEGAVLPIGEQYFIDYMAGASAGAWRAREWQINVPAAKQFLIDHYLYHANGDINPGGAPGYFNEYYNEINSMGWPQNCRKISMISGAENGVPQSAPSGGNIAYEHILKNNRFIKRILFIKLNNDITMLDAKIYVSPSNSQGTRVVLESHVNTLTTILNGLHYRIKYSNPSPLCRNQSLEAVQGGFYWGYNELEESSGGNNTVVKGTLRSVRQFINNYSHIHTHIPTFSSLAIGKGPNPVADRKWDDNINGVNLICPTQKEIPFDAYYGPGTINMRHDSLFYWQSKYLIDEINGINMPGKTIQGLAISGPTSICNNQPGYYSINLPTGGSVVWTASPSGKVYLTVLNSNTVQATPFNSPTGSFTLTAAVTASCITTSVQYSVTFNTTPPPYNCSQVGNGTCTQLVYMCIDQFYAGRSFSIPNKFSDVPYWHWTVSGGTFSDGSTSQILPSYAPDPYVRPQWPNMSCQVYIRPMSQCMMEDSYEPFKYIMINTNQSCNGYYVMSPNPATSEVTISTIEKTSDTQADRSITAVNIYDQQGIMRKQKKFGKTKSAAISISDLVDGMYVVEIVSGDYKEQKQLLVKH